MLKIRINGTGQHHTEAHIIKPKIKAKKEHGQTVIFITDDHVAFKCVMSDEFRAALREALAKN